MIESLKNYNRLKGYLSQSSQCALADEVINDLWQRTRELEAALKDLLKLSLDNSELIAGEWGEGETLSQLRADNLLEDEIVMAESILNNGNKT